MQVTKSKNWPISFRQFLLLNDRVVETWCADRKTYEADFFDLFKQLVEHRKKPEWFFMSDFSLEDQVAMASALGHRLGISFENQMPLDEATRRIEIALQQIGAQ